jgi:hypothetical protein
MQEETSAQNLTERLKLIETMIAEGRGTTTKWGWSFVMWGAAYYVAAAWATWGHWAWAWPVTMTAAAVVSSVVASRMKRGHPQTTMSRAISGVWIAMGCALMIVLMSLAFSGRGDAHVFIAIVGAMLATAHGTSAIILKWKAQMACAVVWIASAVAACFGSKAVVMISFLMATFLGQIVFGIYAMVLDSRRRRAQHGVVHA